LSRVFTVQLRDGPADTADRAELAGRLTHAATGVASHFDSADELVALLMAERRRLRAAADE
jgi:hypothetical protein